MRVGDYFQLDWDPEIGVSTTVTKPVIGGIDRVTELTGLVVELDQIIRKFNRDSWVEHLGLDSLGLKRLKPLRNGVLPRWAELAATTAYDGTIWALVEEDQLAPGTPVIAITKTYPLPMFLLGHAYMPAPPATLLASPSAAGDLLAEIREHIGRGAEDAQVECALTNPAALSEALRLRSVETFDDILDTQFSSHDHIPYTRIARLLKELEYNGGALNGSTLYAIDTEANDADKTICVAVAFQGPHTRAQEAPESVQARHDLLANEGLTQVFQQDEEAGVWRPIQVWTKNANLFAGDDARQWLKTETSRLNGWWRSRENRRASI